MHTIAEAEISAREGCQLCNMVLNAAGTWNGLDPQAEMIVMRIANTSGTPYCQDQVWVESETLPNFERHGPDVDHFLTNFGLYTDEGNFLGDFSLRVLMVFLFGCGANEYGLFRKCCGEYHSWTTDGEVS